MTGTRFMLIPIADAPSHRTWVSYVESQTPRFDVVYSNQALTSRLLVEAGYNVKEIPLYKRSKYEATEIRRRILKGEDWSELVPAPVYLIVKEIDGENRIRDLGKSDSMRIQAKRTTQGSPMYLKLDSGLRRQVPRLIRKDESTFMRGVISPPDPRLEEFKGKVFEDAAKRWNVEIVEG